MLTLLHYYCYYNAIANNRSLKEFDAAVAKHGTSLAADILIQHHLDILYDQLLESNLMKIIEPFSCVEIARVAELIHLPLDKVQLQYSTIAITSVYILYC
jgi:26S proteasome regulatory subunit N6